MGGDVSCVSLWAEEILYGVFGPEDTFHPYRTVEKTVRFVFGGLIVVHDGEREVERGESHVVRNEVKGTNFGPVK